MIVLTPLLRALWLPAALRTVRSRLRGGCGRLGNEGVDPTFAYYNSLFNIYETQTAVMFVPFGTTTAWDGKAYECLWTNDFDFRHSDNNKDAGFSGMITLEEVA